MIVVLTVCAAHLGSLTNDRYAWTVGFGNFFTRQFLEIPTDRPTKVCEKTARFLEKLTCSSRVVLQWNFCLFPLWSNVTTLARNRVNDRDHDVSTEETAWIFSSLIGLPALAEKDMFVVLTAYVGSLTNNRYVDDLILKLVLPDRYSKYRQTDPRFLSDFRKSLQKGCS